MESRSAKSVSPLGILLAIQMLLLLLRLTASLLPELGISVHTNYIAFVISKNMIIFALWCMWLPAMLTSIILLCEQRRSR
jgi:hypothetical protein